MIPYIDLNDSDAVTDALFEFTMTFTEFNSFDYDVLKPAFESLGDLQKNVSLGVATEITDEEVVIHTTLEELERKLIEIRQYNEKARDNNQRIIELDEDEHLLMPLADEHEVEKLIEENQSNLGMITHKKKIERLGCYEHTEDGKRNVVVKWTDDYEQMGITYVREMMYAFFDSNQDRSQTENDYIAEVLTDYAMLHFLHEYYQKYMSKNSYTLLRYAYNHVAAKRYCIGTEHRSFGAYLFDNYMHIDWEFLMRNSLNIPDDNYVLTQDSRKQSLSYIRRGDEESLRNVVRRMLWCMARTDINDLKPKESEGHKTLSHSYGWIFRFQTICVNVDIKVGDVVELNRWEMKIRNTYIHCVDPSFFNAINALQKQYEEKPKLVVTRIESSDALRCYMIVEFELSFNVRKYSVLPERMPWENITEMRVMDGMMFSFKHLQARHRIKFSIDSNCKDYSYDESHNVLIDERNQSVIWGNDLSVVPDKIKEIGDFAFSQCGVMTSIKLPEGLTKIGIGAFKNCDNLVKINIPDSVISIGSGTFDGCRNLPECTLKKAEQLMKYPANSEE